MDLNKIVEISEGSVRKKKPVDFIKVSQSMSKFEENKEPIAANKIVEIDPYTQINKRQ